MSFEEFLGEENHIEKIFKTMDKDNDGFVSKQVTWFIYTYMIYEILLSFIINDETEAMTSYKTMYFVL